MFRYTAADIKHTILRQNKLINYEENLDTSEVCIISEILNFPLTKDILTILLPSLLV